MRLDAMSREQLLSALARLTLQQQINGVDKLHEMLSAEGATFAEEMADVDSADMIEVCSPRTLDTGDAVRAKPDAYAGAAYLPRPTIASV